MEGSAPCPSLAVCSRRSLVFRRSHAPWWGGGRSYVDALGEDCRMMVWDTAGQEEFDAMTRTYYRGRLRFRFG